MPQTNQDKRGIWKPNSAGHIYSSFYPNGNRPAAVLAVTPPGPTTAIAGTSGTSGTFVKTVQAPATTIGGVLGVTGTFIKTVQAPTAAIVGTAGGSSGLVASYDFNAGDDTHTTKNGFSFEANSDVLVTVPGTSITALPFQFTGIGNDLATETIRERRFSFNEVNEAWVHERLFVPPNYKHRYIYLIDVVGDVSSWAIGDSVVAADGSTATIYGVSGGEVKLEFAQNPYPSSWTANVTNTTRSQTRAATHQQKWPANNKSLSIWCDGYSTGGTNPTAIFGTYPVSGLYSSASASYGADNQVTGGPVGEYTDFINAAQLGKWVDIFYGLKLSSAFGVSDGALEMHIKREGESVYTRVINVQGLPLWKRSGVTTGISNAYIHGAQNSGYYETTILYDSMIELYSAKPGFLP